MTDIEKAHLIGGLEGRLLESLLIHLEQLEQRRKNDLC